MHPKSHYLKLRTKYQPTKIKLIFVLESPPESGKYFYDPTGKTTEPLFAGLMKVIGESPATKEQGLTAFARKGFFLVDATYKPVNRIKSQRKRNEAILSDLPELIQDLKGITGNQRLKIILVKANICRLLENPLAAAGFKVINSGAVIPFPSSGHQPNFYKNLIKVLKSMNPNRLTETDLFARFYLRAPDGGAFAQYYASLNAIRPLLGSEEWTRSVTGFFLNVIEGDTYDAVRLSYWTTSPEQPRQVVDKFVAEHSLEYVRQPGEPSPTRNSNGYGDEELRFRRFLAIYTQIGLEIMEADLLNARCLLATFCWQVMRSGQPYKPHFVGTFERHSPFYNALADTEKDQFWSDLSHWPNPPQWDWAHFLVNMVLGCDWPDRISEIISLGPQPPLSISEINENLREQGFQIPHDWQPIEPQT